MSLPFESKFFGKKHKNIEVTTQEMPNKKGKRMSVVVEREKELQCVDTYYSVM